MNTQPFSNGQYESAIKAKDKTSYPSMYKVILLNDDYTPMVFVVKILQDFFEKNTEEATKIMLDVHKNGIGICGVYTFEVAETKVFSVINTARKSGYPLQCEMEKV